MNNNAPWRIPGSFGGMMVRIIDAQYQQRTAKDVRGPWVSVKVPSKAVGRRGTRRAFKRRHPPHFLYLYREPSDVMIIKNRIIIATPAQADALRRATCE
jgi:hypothetical protein